MKLLLPIFLISFLSIFSLKAGVYSAELDTSKYFNEYFYSLTNDGNTEVGTFEVNNYTRESTKIWDPLVAIVLNRIIKYILPVNSIVASGKTIEIANKVTKTVPLNRLNHIFGKAEHALESLVAKFGSQENAYNAVQNVANQALKAGKLTPDTQGILPKIGEILDIEGMKVRLIGGKVKNGKVIISSFSRKGL